MKFELVDLYDNIVKEDSQSSLFISSLDPKFRSSIYTIKAANGVYNLENIAFSYLPSQNVTIKVSSDGIIKWRSLNSVSEINILIKFRAC